MRRRPLYLSDVIQTDLLLAPLSAATAAMRITGLQDDSRAVKPGHLFFAIPGVKIDGRQFATMAAENGALAIITDARPLDSSLKAMAAADVPIIQTHNARLALATAAARFWRKQPGMIAAITGTNGKTSTSEFLRQIWGRATWQSASIGTLGLRANATRKMQGSLMGLPSLTTPDALSLHANLVPLTELGITHLAIEASSHGLEQHRLDGLNIHVATFTNLSHDHLDHHPSMDAYFDAKKRLFTELLMLAGAAVINIDDPYGRQLAGILRSDAPDHVVTTFGHAEDADFRITAIEPVGASLLMRLHHAGTDWQIPLALSAQFQAANALTAALLAYHSGLALHDSLGSLPYLRSVPGRMQTVTGHPTGARVIVDYAHTPDALESALISLRPEAQGNLLVLFGCGGDRDASKRGEMGAIAAKLADRVYVTDDNPRTEDPAIIRNAITASAPDAIEIANRDEAIRTALTGLAAGDVLLIAGKGHEESQIVGDETLPFSDTSVAQTHITALAAAAKAGGTP